MSRYERRLKPNEYNSRLQVVSGQSSSPRPGIATCKIPKRKTGMLSGFISVKYDY